MRPLDNLIDVFRRVGTGLAAAHQGEYLHGWLPAMEGRPTATPQAPRATIVRPRPANPVAGLEQPRQVGAC